MDECLELLEVVEVLHFKVLFLSSNLSKGEYTYGGYSASGGTCKVKQDGLKLLAISNFS